MKTFIHENFLLENAYAQRLYHDYAKGLPIIDYHCHLSTKDIADNRKFENLTKIWLEGDHYKWRAMRTHGINEHFITGNATDFEKFEKWAETVPYTLRNPLYHWAHLELKAYFCIDDLLSPDTAKQIYEKTTALLNTEEYRVRELLKKRKTEIICTTDDPVDTLEYHQKIKRDNYSVKVIPAWRPEKAMNISNPEAFNQYVNKLEAVSKISINTYDDLLKALNKRHDYFYENGCRLSDHAIYTVCAEEYTDKEIKSIFEKVRNNIYVNESENRKFQSALLHEFAIMDNEKGWTQQFHIGALRNNNSRMFIQMGPDTGWDSIGDPQIAVSLARFLNNLDKKNKLTKTILYNINPAHNELLATMAGSFNDGTCKGKIQFGSAWWFLDNKDGIIKQLNTLSNLGLLSSFIGMLTDSRSFLSLTRHDYFRRILCNLFGRDIYDGEVPDDLPQIGKIIQDICYYNAKEYFKF